MGEVWRAYDTTMNRVVALKVLPPNLADDDQYQMRFRREAQVAAGLDEPHVVPIHDFGDVDGRLYVTMRLIDGKTVHELLEQGPLSPQRAVLIVEQIAAALHAAHRVGLVHRDVKPSNILVTDDDFAYLIDFGIARAANATKLTSTGSTIGTLAYMAPERFTSDRVDARADIYALTCVLSECLTGAQPFPGDSVERQLAGHLTLPPPRPSTLRQGVPPRLDDVVAKGMAKDADHRYATTKELAVAARAALAMPAVQDFAPTLASPPPPPPPPPPPTAPSLPPPLPPPAYSAAQSYPHTSQNVPVYHHSPDPNVWPPIPVPMSDSVQGGQPWWRGPAILVPIVLVAVVALAAVLIGVVVFGNDGGSNSGPVASSTARDRPSASSASPTAGSQTSTAGSSAPSSTSAAPAPTQLQTVDGLNGLFESMRGKFGDAMGYRLVIYPDYASVDRPDPTNDRVKQGYLLRGGAWQSWAPPSSTTVFDHLADLSAIDVPAVAATFANAPAEIGAPPGAQGYLIIEGAEGGGLELAIHSNSPGTGFMKVNADGTINRIFPP